MRGCHSMKKGNLYCFGVSTSLGAIAFEVLDCFRSFVIAEALLFDLQQDFDCPGAQAAFSVFTVASGALPAFA